jgi:hypothetical protein
MKKNSKHQVFSLNICIWQGAEENNWKHNQQSKDITGSLSGNVKYAYVI